MYSMSLPYWTIKLGIEGEEGQGVFSKWPLLRDWLGMGLSACGRWWVSDCLCITCSVFSFPPLIKLSLPGPTSFLAFALLFSPWPHREGNELVAVQCSAAGQINPPQAHTPSYHNALLHLRWTMTPHIIFYFLSMTLHHSCPQYSRKLQSLSNREQVKTQDAPIGKLFQMLFLLKAKDTSRYTKVCSSKPWTFWETTQMNLCL